MKQVSPYINRMEKVGESMKEDKGFTLIELLGMIVLVAIILVGVNVGSNATEQQMVGTSFQEAAVNQVVQIENTLVRIATQADSATYTQTTNPISLTITFSNGYSLIVQKDVTDYWDSITIKNGTNVVAAWSSIGFTWDDEPVDSNGTVTSMVITVSKSYFNGSQQVYYALPVGLRMQATAIT